MPTREQDRRKLTNAAVVAVIIAAIAAMVILPNVLGRGSPDGPRARDDYLELDVEIDRESYDEASRICTDIAADNGRPAGHPDHATYWSVCMLTNKGETFLVDYCESLGMRLHGRPVAGRYDPGPRAIRAPADPDAPVWYCS